MAKKRSTKASKSNKKRPAPQRKLDTTQIIAIAVIVVVVVLVAWVSLPKNQNEAASSDSTSSTSSSAVGAKQYASPPAMQIDPKKQYLATVTMENGGQFVIELYPSKAPKTVNNFVFLAREGFYDGTTFHRVLPNFMAQGGDPTGTGGGGPGYQFENEDSDLIFDKAGVVAMANAGRDTNGSQFFITFSPQMYLNGGYTIFGQVVEGLDVVMNIRLRDPQQSPNFVGDAIKSVTIEEK